MIRRYRMNACVDVRLQREGTSDTKGLHAYTLSRCLLSERSTGDASCLWACFYVLWRMRTYFSSCFFFEPKDKRTKTAMDRTSDERPLTSAFAFCVTGHIGQRGDARGRERESETLLWCFSHRCACAIESSSCEIFELCNGPSTRRTSFSSFSSIGTSIILFSTFDLGLLSLKINGFQ